MRRGDDLIVTSDITLTEAIQMKPQSVQTLDSRKVFVSPEELITPQTELVVSGEGMPRGQTGDVVMDTITQLQKKTVQERGDLIVKFNIVFPKRILTEHRLEMLAALREN